MVEAIGAIVAAVIGAIIAIASASETNEVNRQNVESTNALNKQIADESNQLQKDTLEQTQQFNAEEAEKSFERQKELMDYQHQLNSPLEMLKQYREAGVNPSVAFGGKLAQASSSIGSAAQAANSSALSPSVPSMIPFMKQNPVPFNVASGMSDTLLKTTQALKAVHDSRLAESQKKEIDEMLKSRIASLQAQTEGQELANTLQSMYGDARFKAELALLGKQALFYAEQGKTEEFERCLKDSQVLLNKALAHESGSKRELIDKQNSSYMTELRARVENLYSQSAVNYSQRDVNKAEELVKGSELLNNVELRKKFIAETMEVLARAIGVTLDNEQKEQLAPLLEEQLRKEIRQQGQDYWNPFRYVGTLLGGSAASMITKIIK